MKHKYGVVRSVDVARYMGFSKPSISHAVKELRKKEYLCLDDSGNLVLTDKGIEMWQLQLEHWLWDVAMYQLV